MKRVYLTALTNERYIPGVMALARSLHEVKSEYELAIMVPAEKADTLDTLLRNYGVWNVPGTFLLPKEGIHLEIIETVIEEKYSYWRDTFYKLQASSCTEYDKVVLLDSDMLVVNNIDHLFELPAFTATVCGQCVHDDWRSLNSGLLVLEPSKELQEKLLALIVPAIHRKASQGLQAGDQDVFQMVFPEWRDHPELFIPENYSICWGWISDLCKKNNCTPTDFYVIHFVGKEKPWDFSRHHYLRLFASMLIHGKLDKIIYKTLIWKKYRDLCDRL